MTQSLSLSSPRWKQLVGYLALPLLAVVWAYWTSLQAIAERWESDPQYSHGYLVPLFSLVLLWLRRDKLQWDQLNPSWWGVPLLVLSIAVRGFGAYKHYPWLEHIPLLPCVVGLCLIMGGWAALRWAWPALLFLFFMIPLPYSVGLKLAGPLQNLATIASTYALQTFGLPALSEGNTILVEDHRIGIVEACSGLRMLVVFFALATGLVLVVNRPWPDKVILVASAIPIALIANVIRVIITGLLYVNVSNSKVAHVFFHDVAGWIMMPMALGMMWVEMKILKRLLVETDAGPTPVPQTTKTRSGARVGKKAPTQNKPRATVPVRRSRRSRNQTEEEQKNVTDDPIPVPAQEDVA